MGKLKVYWILPCLILFAILFVVPIIYSVYDSFFYNNVITREFIGLKNYAYTFTQPDMVRVLINTLIYAVVIVLTQNVAALIISLSIYRLRTEAQKWIRILFYVPILCTGVTVGLIYRWMFSAVDGPLAWSGVAWLQSRWPAIAAISWVLLTLSLGGKIIIYLSGLLGIDRAYTEAAMIDGATQGQIDRLVLLPFLYGTISIMTLFSLISAMTFVGVPFMLRTTHDANNFMYSIFVSANYMGEYGLANAQTVLLTGMMIIMLLAKNRIEKKYLKNI